jgi:hypothetical protein
MNGTASQRLRDNFYDRNILTVNVSFTVPDSINTRS